MNIMRKLIIDYIVGMVPESSNERQASKDGNFTLAICRSSDDRIYAKSILL